MTSTMATCICKHIHRVHSLALTCGKTVPGTPSQQRYQVEDTKAILTNEGEDYDSSNDDYTEIAYAESVYDPEKGVANSLYVYLISN